MAQPSAEDRSQCGRQDFELAFQETRVVIFAGVAQGSWALV